MDTIANILTSEYMNYLDTALAAVFLFVYLINRKQKILNVFILIIMPTFLYYMSEYCGIWQTTFYYSSLALLCIYMQCKVFKYSAFVSKLFLCMTIFCVILSILTTASYLNVANLELQNLGIAFGISFLIMDAITIRFAFNARDSRISN